MVVRLSVAYKTRGLTDYARLPILVKFLRERRIGSRPSDHYFRSVCLFCLFVCAEFFSAVFDPIWIKLGHMLHVRV